MTDVHPLIVKMKALMAQQAETQASNIAEQAEIAAAVTRDREAEAARRAANPALAQERHVLPEPGLTPTEAAWIEDLPVVDAEAHEFLIEIDFDDSRLICCLRELTWPLALDIETRGYRTNSRQVTYFSGEYERRETLKHAIRWIGVLPAQQLDQNSDGRILKRLHQDVVDVLWREYNSVVEIGSDEAVALYQSASSYFSGQSQQGSPTPSLIVEVDAMLSGLASMTRAELRSLTRSDMERIQIIKMARAEALGLISDEQQYRVSSTRLNDQIESSMAALEAARTEATAAYGGEFYPPTRDPHRVDGADTGRHP